MAYQGYGRGADINVIQSIEEQSINNFKPDLTILLDIDVKTGLSRSHARLATEQGSEQTEDRFERMDVDFHERLRQGFLSIAKAQNKRVIVFDADQNTDILAAQIKQAVLARLT